MSALCSPAFLPGSYVARLARTIVLEGSARRQGRHWLAGTRIEINCRGIVVDAAR